MVMTTVVEENSNFCITLWLTVWLCRDERLSWPEHEHCVHPQINPLSSQVPIRSAVD